MAFTGSTKRTCMVSKSAAEKKNEKIGPQCVRLATVLLFALVCEYGAV